MATDTDDFNRANGAPGSEWTGAYGDDLQIVSNRITGTSTNPCFMYFNAFTPAGRNYYAQAKTYGVGASEWNGVCVGMSATDAHVLEADSDVTGFSLYYMTSNTWFKLGASYTAGGIADGDVLRLEKYGSELIAKINGTERMRSASAYLPDVGFAGLYSSSNNGEQLDDFEVGDLTPSAPYVASSNYKSGTTLSGGVAMNMPANITAGNLLIAIASNDNTGGTGMAISGWTQLAHTQYTGNVISHGVWAKIAAGGDTATLTGAAQDYACMILQIANHNVVTIATDIKVGTPATGSDANPNPSSLDAGSSKNWFWLATMGADDDDEAASGTDFEPSGYAGIYPQVESAQSTSSTMIQVGFKVTTTQTENPGTFTMAAAEEWIANTIAIPPTPSGLSATVNQVTESDAAQAIARQKQKAIGQNTETDTAQTLTRVKRLLIGQNTETDSPQAFTAQKIKTIGQVTETDIAQAFLTNIIGTANQVAETDEAQSLTARKIKEIAQISETDIAQSLSVSKARVILQIEEIDTAQPILSIKQKSIGQVEETDFAQPFAEIGAIVAVIGQVSETDLAQQLFPLKRLAIVQVEENDIPQSIARVKVKTLGQVTESDFAQSILQEGVITVTIGQVVEVDSVFHVARSYTGYIGDLTLYPRRVDLSLDDRTTELTLDRRSQALSLQELA